MNNERKHKIVAAIQQQMDVRNFTQAKMANWIGEISTAHLNFVLNSKWKSISENLWLRLEGIFLPKDWAIYETGNFKAIQNLCADSQYNSISNCISDYTGAGKTVALEAYSKRNPNAFYVLCDPMMTKKDFAREMQSALGISQEGSARYMVMAVIKELSKLDKPVLLIDEADKLNDRNLMILKVIYDRLQSRCGFVTCGTEVLRERVDKFAKRNKLGYREWKRRFAQYRKLNRFNTRSKVIREEIFAICNDQGITQKSQIDHILANATNYDDVRTFIQEFQRTKREASTSSQLKAELV